MRSRGVLIPAAGLIGVVLLAATGALRGAEAPDPAAVRDTAMARVCLVTAENAIGVPVAYASGFLLGEGRFAVTDLATLSRPDVKQVRLRFRNGSTAVATQFAVADPSTGLAVVKVEQLPAGLSGLALATAAAAEGPGEVTVVGHKWAQEPDKPEAITGQLSHAISSTDLAARLKIDPPKQSISFFNFSTINPEEASGSPVLDQSGSVVGILLRFAGADKPVVVSAPALWAAMVASDRQLKPLAELPKALWPVVVLPVPGKPATPQDFAQTLRLIKVRSQCANCKSKGTITVRTPSGTVSVGGMTRTLFKDETKTCPACKGEGLVFPDGLYAQYVRMAEGGAWMALAGGVDSKVRETVFANSVEVLKAVAKVGKGYRDDMIKAIKADLSKGGKAGPRGMVVYAQVRESVEGPDGQYVFLSPQGAEATFAARSDRMAAAAEVRGKQPDQDRWIVFAGVAMGPVTLGSRQATYVQPFAWADGPHFDSPLHKGGGSSSSPAAPKPPGAPSFFGL